MQAKSEFLDRLQVNTKYNKV